MFTVKLMIASPEDLEANAQELVRNLQADYPTPAHAAPLRVAEAAAPYGTELTHHQERYLAVIASFPFTSETARDDEFRKTCTHMKPSVPFSRATGSRWRQQLKEMNLIQEARISLGKQSGQLKMLTLTDAGYEILDRKKLEYQPIRGNGGIAHKFWQHTVAQWLERRDWKHVKIEARIKDKDVDVGAIARGEMVAYEVVETGTLDKEVSNYEKDIADGWHRIVFCVESPEVGERLSMRLPDDTKAEVKLLKDFL